MSEQELSLVLQMIDASVWKDLAAHRQVISMKEKITAKDTEDSDVKAFVKDLVLGYLNGGKITGQIGAVLVPLFDRLALS